MTHQPGLSNIVVPVRGFKGSAVPCAGIFDSAQRLRDEIVFLFHTLNHNPNPNKPEPNKDFTTKHTKGTKNEFLMALWYLRVLRDLRGELISAHYGYIRNPAQI